MNNTYVLFIAVIALLTGCVTKGVSMNKLHNKKVDNDSFIKRTYICSYQLKEDADFEGVKLKKWETVYSLCSTKVGSEDLSPAYSKITKYFDDFYVAKPLSGKNIHFLTPTDSKIADTNETSFKDYFKIGHAIFLIPDSEDDSCNAFNLQKNINEYQMKNQVPCQVNLLGQYGKISNTFNNTVRILKEDNTAIIIADRQDDEINYQFFDGFYNRFNTHKVGSIKILSGYALIDIPENKNQEVIPVTSKGFIPGNSLAAFIQGFKPITSSFDFYGKKETALHGYSVRYRFVDGATLYGLADKEGLVTFDARWTQPVELCADNAGFYCSKNKNGLWVVTNGNQYDELTVTHKNKNMAMQQAAQIRKEKYNKGLAASNKRLAKLREETYQRQLAAYKKEKAAAELRRSKWLSEKKSRCLDVAEPIDSKPNQLTIQYALDTCHEYISKSQMAKIRSQLTGNLSTSDNSSPRTSYNYRSNNLDYNSSYARHQRTMQNFANRTYNIKQEIKALKNNR